MKRINSQLPREEELLSLSQRKMPSYIKNWRPLTLLNCDYKLAAKAIANRLKNFLPNLINNDQTGFIKGRFIGENIRLLESIISYVKEKNMPELLLFLDFDTIEWPFISIL